MPSAVSGERARRRAAVGRPHSAFFLGAVPGGIALRGCNRTILNGWSVAFGCALDEIDGEEGHFSELLRALHGAGPRSLKPLSRPGFCLHVVLPEKPATFADDLGSVHSTALAKWVAMALRAHLLSRWAANGDAPISPCMATFGHALKAGRKLLTCHLARTRKPTKVHESQLELVSLGTSVVRQNASARRVDRSRT